MSATSSSSSGRECSKSWCHNLVDLNYKMCTSCRQKSRSQTAKSRNLKRQKEVEEVDIENFPAQVPRTVYRESPRSAGREQEALMRILNEMPDESSSASKEVPHNLKPMTFLGFTDLRKEVQTQFQQHKTKKVPLAFAGTFTLPYDEYTSHEERVRNLMRSIWKVTDVRFTVRNHERKPDSHAIRAVCCQDIKHKKPPKPKPDGPGVRHRDTLPMKRWECGSKLTVRSKSIAYNRIQVTIRITHKHPHLDDNGAWVPYYDVELPEAAIEIIRQNAECLTPSEIMKKIKPIYPAISTNQVNRAWRKVSKDLWCRDSDQLESAKKLLEEFSGSGTKDAELLEVGQTEGVQFLAFAMPSMISQLQKVEAVAEIVIDATYNTNDKHLELYTVMTEYDNVGFPLSYCLLSTASSISNQKRTKAIQKWLTALRDKYGIRPKFAHTDKDMAEIAAIRAVWPEAKIQICYWHARKAHRERLGNNKLSTTPYSPGEANREFRFITPNFFPKADADPDDWEGGRDAYADRLNYAITGSGTLTVGPNSLVVKVPPSTQPSTPAPSATPKPLPPTRSVKLIVNPPAAPKPKNAKSTKNKRLQRLFCPDEYRKPIEDMFECHMNAHPLIPGYSAPTCEGIREWAVRQMYDFCFENDLPEVWAYLSGNWYRAGRWELWARSVYPSEISILKTTMMVERHWRTIKHEYLHHFHKPRVDLLCWILLQRMMPMFQIKLGRYLGPLARYRELASWRKSFKREWRRCENAPTTSMPINPKYNPRPHDMVCTCPHFVTSRFLICKHLVQLHHKVPALFFAEVRRRRTLPIWKHPALVPLTGPIPDDKSSTPDGGSDALAAADLEQSDAVIETLAAEAEELDDDDPDLAEVDAQNSEESSSVRSKLMERAALLIVFAACLQYQAQFEDARYLAILNRQGQLFFKYIDACLDYERRMNSTQVPNPRTWASSTTMFYRARPRSDVAQSSRAASAHLSSSATTPQSSDNELDIDDDGDDGDDDDEIYGGAP